MNKKVRKADGTIVEVGADYVLQEGETFVSDDDAKMADFLTKQVEKITKTILEGANRKDIQAKDADVVLEKSILQTDPFMRKHNPFIKLSKSMESFVKDIKVLAKGGMPETMQKALAEGVDTTGGFLVPEEFSTEVIRYATETAIIRPRARIVPMSRDSISYPKLDQSSDNFAGVTLYWGDESDSITASNPTFGKIKLNAKKLVGLVPVPDELLADSAVNLANFLVSLFGEAIAYEEDYRFLRGTGVGQPLGIINTYGITSVARSASSKIKLDDILGMWAQMPAWARANAIWITSVSGETQIMRIPLESETTKNFVWMPSLREGAPATLMGKPLLLTEKVPAVGTTGDIILGNLDYYYIGDRSGLEVSSSIHDRFRYDETTFRFIKRVDGQPSIAKAFVVLGA